MKKVITLTAALFLATASTHALAASGKCQVTAVSDTAITLDCGSKNNDFKVDDTVKIRTATQKRRAIEGC